MDRFDVPMVSVVIPTYNCAEYIAGTLQSVRDQTYPNLEIIVVDDGSTDATRDVVRAFGSEKITYFYQSNSGGPSKPRNVGIQLARGKYIALCDSDDIILPDKLSEAVAFLEDQPHLGLTFANFVRCDEKGVQLTGSFLDTYEGFWKLPKKMAGGKRFIIESQVAYDHLFYENFIGTSGVVIPKNILLSLGKFDESLSGPEDLDMWFRISKIYDIGFLDMVGHRYRRRKSGITGGGAKMLSSQSIRMIRKNLAKGGLAPLTQKQAHWRIAQHFFDLGYCHQCCGEMKQARVNYWLSLREAVSWPAVKGILVSLLGRRIVALLRDCRAKRDNTYERIKNL